MLYNCPGYREAVKRLRDERLKPVHLRYWPNHERLKLMDETDLQEIANHIKGISRVIGGDVAHTAYELIGVLVDGDFLHRDEAEVVKHMLPKS